MTRIHHTTNTARPRARLISTPTTEGAFMSTSTVAGVKFSDTLAALLDHAEANGFRIEKGAGRFTGVTVYAPDTDIPPIRVTEKSAKFNRAHYENIRRELYKSGCPPLPADLPSSDGIDVGVARSEAAAKAAIGKGAVGIDLGHGIGIAGSREDADGLDRILHSKDAGDFMGKMIMGLAARAGLGAAEQDLVAALTQLGVEWSLKYSPDRINASAEKFMSAEVEEALEMASAKEREANRLQAEVDKAYERENQARADCKEALRRAEVAEAKAAELEAAIAPLRALLAG